MQTDGVVPGPSPYCQFSEAQTVIAGPCPPTTGMSSSLKAMDRATPWPPGLAPMACCCSRATLQKWLPILAWLPDYSMQWLKMDFIAGLSVGLTVIPQALAYAEVAGLPAQVRDLPSCPLHTA